MQAAVAAAAGGGWLSRDLSRPQRAATMAWIKQMRRGSVH